MRARALLAVLLVSSAASAYEANHVFITNRGKNNVLELDQNLAYVKSWFDAAGLSVPNGMAFDPSDRMYVADTGNNRIVVFDNTGSVQNSFSTLSVLSPQVESLNFNAAGRLFASANPGNGTVASWKADGTDQQNLVQDSAYQKLGNVNFSMTGHVLLSDFSGTRGVRELDPNTGALLKEFGQGTSKHEDMVIDADDNVFVSAFDQNKILKFDAARNQVAAFSPPGLVHPTGIVLTSTCKLIVASFSTDEIFELDYDGTFIKKFTVPGLSLPESLVIAKLNVAGSVAIGSPVPDCSGPDGGVGGTGGADASSGGSSGSGGGGASSGGSGGSSGTGAAAGAGGSTAGAGGGTSGGGTSSTGGTPAKGGTESADDGGCGCRTTRDAPEGGFVLFALSFLAARRRRGEK